MVYHYNLGRLRSKETKSRCIFYFLFPRTVPYKMANCCIGESKILGKSVLSKSLCTHTKYHNYVGTRNQKQTYMYSILLSELFKAYT